MKRLYHTDPNDPKNAELMKMLETLRVSEKRGQMFRLEAHQHELLLASGDPRVYRRPVRHKLLQLRNKKPDLFSKPLPLTQEEIRADEALRQVGPCVCSYSPLSPPHPQPNTTLPHTPPHT